MPSRAKLWNWLPNGRSISDRCGSNFCSSHYIIAASIPGDVELTPISLGLATFVINNSMKSQNICDNRFFEWDIEVFRSETNGIGLYYQCHRVLCQSPLQCMIIPKAKWLERFRLDTATTDMAMSQPKISVPRDRPYTEERKRSRGKGFRVNPKGRNRHESLLPTLLLRSRSHMAGMLLPQPQFRCSAQSSR